MSSARLPALLKMVAVLAALTLLAGFVVLQRAGAAEAATVPVLSAVEGSVGADMDLSLDGWKLTVTASGLTKNRNGVLTVTYGTAQVLSRHRTDARGAFTATVNLASHVGAIRVQAATSGRWVERTVTLPAPAPTPPPPLSAEPSPAPTPKPSPTPTKSPGKSPSKSPSPSPSPTPSPSPSPSPAGVVLRVGADLQSVVDANPAGTTYVLEAGLHRMQRIIPKSGDRFVGQSGAVMSGARILSAGSFTKTASGWSVGGQTQEGSYYTGDPRARMLPGHFAEDRPEELFSNGQRLRKVDSLAAMTEPGTWYFDYAADRIHVRDDPASLGLLETSVTDHAFSGPATDVTIENVAVRNYANQAQRGAVDGEDGIGWIIRHVDASYNHGAGIRGSRAGTVANSRVTYNGQIGMIASGRINEGEGKYAPMLIEANEIAYNKALGYDPGWEGGGTKFVKTDRSVFRNNWVHDNWGYGLWFDMDNKNALIESNLVERNELLGIFYEISKSAVIRWNISRDNGQGTANGKSIGDDGAAMFIANSSEVEVYGNALSGPYGWPFLANHRSYRVGDPTSHFGNNIVANVHVHHNDMLLTTSFVGIKSDVAETFSARNNRFEGNTYRSNGNRWSWNNQFHLDRAAWQNLGMDRTGTFTTDLSAPKVAADGVAFSKAVYGSR